VRDDSLSTDKCIDPAAWPTGSTSLSVISPVPGLCAHPRRSARQRNQVQVDRRPYRSGRSGTPPSTRPSRGRGSRLIADSGRGAARRDRPRFCGGHLCAAHEKPLTSPSWPGSGLGGRRARLGGSDRVRAGQAAVAGGPHAAWPRVSHPWSRCQPSGRWRVMCPQTDRAVRVATSIRSRRRVAPRALALARLAGRRRRAAGCRRWRRRSTRPRWRGTR
jgi:hypothetical protein